MSTLPKTIRIWVWVAGLGTAGLAGELVWEQTVLTWTQGPQMVWFSLAHTFLIGLLLFPLVLSVWIVTVAGISIRDRFERHPVSWHRVAALLLAVLPLAAMTVRDSTWQRLFARRLAESGFANEFMTLNAASGDVATMAALAAQGVPLDGRTPEGETLLHLAARLGRLDVIAFLASKGADPNARDRYGDTPLDVAISARHEEAVQLLIRLYDGRLTPAKPRVDEPIQVTVRP